MATQLVNSVADHAGWVFFSDATSGATLSRATEDGRVWRPYSAELRAEPEELLARNRWTIVARLMPDAVIADRWAACPREAC